jgi:hypothetical protein
MKWVGGVYRKSKVGRAMSSIKLPPEFLAELQELASRWGKIAAQRTAAGVDSQQLDFADLERVAAVLAAGLTEGTLTALIQQRNDTVTTEQPCPQCGTACPVDYEDRALTIDTGHVLTLHEPVCHCPHCRRDFFPPAGRSAPGQP